LEEGKPKKKITFSLNRGHFSAKGAICVAPFFVVAVNFTTMMTMTVLQQRHRLLFVSQRKSALHECWR